MTRGEEDTIEQPAVAIEAGHGDCVGLDWRVTKDAFVVSKMVTQYRRVDFAMPA